MSCYWPVFPQLKHISLPKCSSQGRWPEVATGFRGLFVFLFLRSLRTAVLLLVRGGVFVLVLEARMDRTSSREEAFMMLFLRVARVSVAFADDWRTRSLCCWSLEVAGLMNGTSV